MLILQPFPAELSLDYLSQQKVERRPRNLDCMDFEYDVRTVRTSLFLSAPPTALSTTGVRQY